MERLRIGEILIEAGVLSEGQLTQALSIQKDDGRRLGSILLAYGFVAEPQLVQALSRQLSIPWVSLWHVDVPDELLDLVPVGVVKECNAVPVYIRSDRERGPSLYVAMDDPTNEEAIERVSLTVRMPVVAMVAGPSDIAAAIKEFYGEAGEASMEISAPRIELHASAVTAPIEELEPLEELEPEPEPEELEPEELEPVEPEEPELEEPEPEPEAPELKAEEPEPEETEAEEPVEVALEKSSARGPRELFRESDTVTDAKAPPREIEAPPSPADSEATTAEPPPELDDVEAPGEVVTLEEAHVVDSERDTEPPVPVEAEPDEPEEPEPEEPEPEEPETEEPEESVEAVPVASTSEDEKDTEPPVVEPAREPAPEAKKGSRPPGARRASPFALTLLDGTTIELSNTSTHGNESEPIGSVPELVALLRASARGAPLPKPLPATKWEAFVANLIELLVSKRLLDEDEVLESLLR